MTRLLSSEMRIPPLGTALFVWRSYVNMKADASTTEGTCGENER